MLLGSDGEADETVAKIKMLRPFSSRNDDEGW
jgi:hypothetical protein